MVKRKLVRRKIYKLNSGGVQKRRGGKVYLPKSHYKKGVKFKSSVKVGKRIFYSAK